MIDRKLYTKYIAEENMSKWQCPTCNNGVLQLLPKNLLKENNSATTINYHEEWFEAPEMIVFTYTALLTCTNPNCKEIVATSGSGIIEEEHIQTYNGYDREYIDCFKPNFFYPPLHIFAIPEKTPKNIKESIISSFSIFFSNKSAAANQVRIALECLLTHLKIKRFNITRGKRRRLNLHQRIELLPIKYQKIKEVCLAIKWLGNAGSHCDDEMTFDDVFDGYDMLSFVLEELYDNKHTHVKKLAKKINDKRGV